MADPTLPWWKLVLDAAGRVKSCRQVDAAAAAGQLVLYVQAVDKDAAELAAANRYAARKTAERRARYKTEGRCRCGRVPDDRAYTKCSECRRLDQVHESRMLARKRGQPVPPRNRLVTDRARKETEAAQARLAVLREVEAAWVDAPTNKAFSAWLTQQIEALTGRRVA